MDEGKCYNYLRLVENISNASKVNKEGVFKEYFKRAKNLDFMQSIKLLHITCLMFLC